jgi:lantibiotic modifying enzyme
VRPDYLEGAVGAARWILGRQVGSHWPSRPAAVREEELDLYYGNAGAILFFQELAESTDDQRYLKAVSTGAHHIAAQVGTLMSSGLFHGLAGVAFALQQVSRGKEEKNLLDSLNRVIVRFQINAIPNNPGVCWNESNDIVYGTAGIGPTLIRLAKESGKEELLKLAAAGGDHLLSQQMTNGSYRTLSVGHSTNYPNFSHGTAGIGYFLAELHAATDEERYCVSALAAGHYLQSIISAASSSQGLIFHNDTTGQDLFYLGWCHGPPGTGRFFYRLYQLTGESGWLDLVRRQATTLMASGIPERQTPGYWNNVSRCCGAAGVGEFFLGLYTATEDIDYLVFAERIAEYLLGRGETDGSGMKWTQAEMRRETDRLVAQTGLMQGAAGIGLFLIHVDQALRRDKPLIRFLDEPWGKDSASVVGCQGDSAE